MTPMIEVGPALRQPSKDFWLSYASKPIFFFLIVLTVAGIYGAVQVPISVFPDTNFPRVVIGVDNGVMPVEQMQVSIEDFVRELRCFDISAQNIAADTFQES